MDIGTSFQPGQAQQNGLKSPDQARQEAVKVLSLRLPKVIGGSPLAPAPLLTSLGSAGGPTPGMPQRAPTTNQPQPAPRVGLDPSAGQDAYKMPVPDPTIGLRPAGGGQPAMAMSPIMQALGMLAGLPMPGPTAAPGQGQPQAPHVTPGVLEGDNPQGLPTVNRDALIEPTSAPATAPQAAPAGPSWLDQLRQKYDAEQQANSGPQIQGNY